MNQYKPTDKKPVKESQPTQPTILLNTIVDRINSLAATVDTQQRAIKRLESTVYELQRYIQNTAKR